MSRLRGTHDAHGRDHPACALQRTAEDMTEEINRIYNQSSSSLPESSPVFRNDLLLPVRSFSCIVVYEKGLRSSPVVPLFTKIQPLSSLRPCSCRLPATSF
jgi:hypothetical protein